MRIKIVFLISVAIFLFDIAAMANSDKKTSIALITDKASGLNKSPLVSLLEAELSHKDGIQLLERAAVDKILDEQKLSAAGLLDRNNSIKIGKLLRADAFIILSLENQTKDANDLIRVRISETAHGLRLLDYFEQSESKNPKDAVERIIKKLEAVLKKINQPDEKLIPIGIVDIHRVQLGEQYKTLERTLPVMLSVRLSLEPQIIMLEREDLKVLLDEKLRTEGQDSKFWNSAILIEGYLQPNNSHLEMHLSLKQPTGSVFKSFTIPVEPNEPAIAIAKATNEIEKQLHDTPTTVQWQPELEAEEFYQRGLLLAAHSRQGEAMPLFETAHALQPENVFYTGKVFEIEWITRDHLYWSTLFANISYHFYTDLELANLVSVFVRQLRNAFEKDIISVRQFQDLWWHFLGFDLSTGYFMEPASVSTDQIKLINKDNRKILLDTIDKTVKRQETSSKQIRIDKLFLARFVLMSSDDPYECMRNLKKAFTRFVMPPELGGESKLNYERSNIYDQVFRITTRDLSRSHLKDSTDIFDKLWREYLIELTKTDDLVVRFNTNLDLGYVQPGENDIQKINQAKPYLLEAMRLFPEHLANNGEQSRRIVGRIEEYFRFMKLDTNEVIRVWINVLEPLIEKKDVRTLAFLDPGLMLPYTVIGGIDNGKPGGGAVFYDPNAKQWYFTLEKISQLLKTQNTNPQIARALTRIQDRQAQIRRNLPGIDKNLNTQNIAAKMILKKDDWLIPIKLLPSFKSAELQAKIQDKTLWISFVSRSINSILSIKAEPVIINLVGIDLEKGSILSLWQAELPVMPDFFSARSIDLEIGKDISYIVVKNVGIVELPGILNKERKILKNPKIYSTVDGLPSLLITSIAEDGNNLIVAYGEQNQESGLGIYDPKTEKWKSIFCSTLNSTAPFNSGTPYQIQYLKLTNSGQLYFTLYDMNLGSTKIGNLLGLWSLDLNNPEVAPLKVISAASKLSHPVLTVAQNKWWIWYADTSIIEYDISTKAYSFINWNPYAQKNGSVTYKPYESAVHNGIFWGPWSGDQIIKIKVGGKMEEAEMIDNNILDGEPVWMFVSTPYGLIGIGEGIVGLIETNE